LACVFLATTTGTGAFAVLMRARARAKDTAFACARTCVGEYENGHDKSKTESALAASCDAFEDETETWRRLIKVGGCEMVLTWGGFGVGDRDERHG
jgi:hypothetical protein